MTLHLGRVSLSRPNSIPYDRRGSEDAGLAGPFWEDGFQLRGRESGSAANATMLALAKEGRRNGHVYVVDDDAVVPEGYYEIEEDSYEQPPGAPRHRPWSCVIARKQRPITHRQVEDVAIGGYGTTTAEPTAEEAYYVAYTATASEVVVARMGTKLGLALRFDGSLADSSGYGHVITLTGGATAYAAGKVGQGHDFDGATWYSLPDHPVLNSRSFTLEAWAKFDSVASIMTLFRKGGTTATMRYLMQLNSNGKIRMQLGYAAGSTQTINGTTALVAGTLYHLVYVYDGAADLAYLYLNGASDATPVAVGAALNVTANNVGVGGTLGGGNLTDGVLDELRWYPWALSAAEVLARYTATSAGVRPAKDHEPALEPLNLPAGTYQVIARVQSRTTVTQRFRAVLRGVDGTALTTGAQVTVGAGNADAWVDVDLGAVVVPSANDGLNSLDLSVHANGDLNAVWLDRVKVVPA